MDLLSARSRHAAIRCPLWQWRQLPSANPVRCNRTLGLPETKPATVKPSIVGLWHIQFTVGGQTIQEAYQIWNAGGTEVHNPNVDPRSGNVCLGVWKHAAHGAYKLAHRVWSYDTNGNFMGTINLSETLTLGDGGKKHSGSFALDFYDPSGKFLMEVDGSVTGERISVE